MKTETITLDNVDTAKLDQQRLVLAGIVINDHGLSKTQEDALEGIVNMLDTWSDKRHFQYDAKTHVEGRYADDAPYPKVTNVTGNIAGLLALHNTIPDDAESVTYSGLTFFEHASIMFRDTDGCDEGVDLAVYPDRWSVDKLIISRTEAQLVYMSVMYDTRFVVTITRSKDK